MTTVEVITNTGTYTNQPSFKNLKNFIVNPDLDKLFPITSKALNMFAIGAVYIYTIVNLLANISFGLGILIYGLNSLNKQFWLEIGIVIMTIVSMILQLAANLVNYKIWKKWKINYASQLSWNFNNISLKVENKINFLCKRVKISFVSCCSLVIFATAAVQIDVIPHISHFRHNLKFIATLERYIPFLHPISLISLTIGTQYMAVLLTMALYYPYYFNVLTKIQLKILQGNIETFQENMPSATDNNRHCYVKKGLRKIIKKHHEIWRLYCHLNREQLPSIGLTTVSLLLCLMFDTTLLYSPYYSSIPPMINYTTTLITAFYFSTEGQAFEDLVGDISDSLYNLNWYDWNKENQKTFSTFFGMNRPSRIHGSTNAMIQINHMYFKRSVKMAYTLVNLARTISHK